MPQVVVRKQIPQIKSYPIVDTLVIKQRVPQIFAYDSLYIEPPVPYIDGGQYNQEGIVADAGLYSTSSWEIVWDGGTP